MYISRLDECYAALVMNGFQRPQRSRNCLERRFQRSDQLVSGGAKYNLGFDLRLLPQGQQPTDYRAMSSVGPGVCELRDQDRAGLVSRDLFVEGSRRNPRAALF
jgi:phage-related protein